MALRSAGGEDISRSIPIGTSTEIDKRALAVDEPGPKLERLMVAVLGTQVCVDLTAAAR